MTELITIVGCHAETNEHAEAKRLPLVKCFQGQALRAGSGCWISRRQILLGEKIGQHPIAFAIVFGRLFRGEGTGVDLRQGRTVRFDQIGIKSALHGGDSIAFPRSPKLPKFTISGKKRTFFSLKGGGSPLSGEPWWLSGKGRHPVKEAVLTSLHFTGIPWL